MTNHVHLLIETPATPISKIMQLINFTYTQYFNKKYRKVGHLFQRRYKAYLCDRNEYLLSLLRYIHLNPVRAKLVDHPDEYPWSSHSEYLKGNKDIIEPGRVLRLFSEGVSHARRLYREFITDAIETGRNDSFYKVVDQQLLGNDRFIEKVGKKIKKMDKPLRKPSLREILDAVRKVTGIGCEEIASRTRRKDIMFAKGVFVSVWRECGYRMVDLQPVLRRDLSVLSRLSKVSETKEGQRTTRKVSKELYAYMQA